MNTYPLNISNLPPHGNWNTGISGPSFPTIDTRPPACTLCGLSPALLQCPACKNVFYCSQTCHSEDKPVHRILCKSVSEVLRSRLELPQGDDIAGYYLTIVFPTDRRKLPKLHWLPYKNSLPSPIHVSDGLQAVLQKPTTILPPGQSSNFLPRTMLITRNVLRGTSLQIPGISDGITIHFTSDEYLPMAAPRVPNNAVRALNKHRSCGSDWESTAICAIRVNNYSQQPMFHNISIGDLSHLADFFAVYDTTRGNLGIDLYTPEEWFDVPDHVGPEALVQGVMINCDAGVETLLKQKFAVRQVSTLHQIFCSKPVGISVLLGIPICVMRLPPNHGLWGLKIPGRRMHGATNMQAGWLNLVLDIESEEWGMIAAEWRGEVGDACAVRLDGKALLPEHIDVIAYYASRYLWMCSSGLVKEWQEHKCLPKGAMQGHNRKITRDDFLEVWEKLKASGELGSEVPSPYDM